MIQLITLFAVFISIFLYGMTIMRIGLYNMAHKRIETILFTLTNTPLKGMLVGTLVTACLQSSSAVMIMTIGLVSASYISFKQSIGIILGANIGTTLTAELIAINIYYAVPFLLIIGLSLMIFHNRVIFSIGIILFGLGCIFVAMNGFESLASAIATVPVIKSAIYFTNESNIIGIAIGTLLTAIIQSSTATTGIVMGFLNQGLMALPAGTAIILGANIGTCITAFLASIGGKKEAKLTAYAHIWINLLGVLFFYPFIHPLSTFIFQTTTLPNAQLAHVSLVFNVLSSVIALPFTGKISSLVLKLHGKC